MKKFYIVESFRWGDETDKSYIVGICSDLNMANSFARSEELYRGGKYDCRISEVVENERIETLKVVKELKRRSKLTYEMRNIIRNMELGEIKRTLKNSKIQKIVEKYEEMKQKIIGSI